VKEKDTYGLILGDCKRNLPSPVVGLKHSDPFTRDIPDLEVCWRGRSYWAEIKFIAQDVSRRGRFDTLKSVVDRPAQILFCHELYRATLGRAWVLVYEERGIKTHRFQPLANYPRVVVWKPETLFGALWPQVAGPVVQELGTTPIEVKDGRHLRATVNSVGVASVPWSYDVFRALIDAEDSGGNFT